MNKVEFDRRVALAIKTTQSLLGGSGDDPDSPEAEGMTQSEALSFYEHVIDVLDTQLEEMMAAWQEPAGLAEEAKSKSKSSKPDGLG